jgi:AbiV family abortive infection protein
MSLRVMNSVNAWDGARFALQNADDHLACADSLAENRLYGFAISHLVLAAEEAVKSFSFLLHAIGLPLPEADARKLLTNHTARHQLAQMSQVLTDFLGRSIDVAAMVSDNEAPTPSAILDKIPEALGGWQAYVSGSHDPELILDIQWWGSANSFKQAGMYVDPVAEGGWRCPSDFSEHQYRDSAASVRRFFTSVDTMIRPFLKTDAETQMLLTKFLNPVVQQLNGGRAEEISALLFGLSKEP